MFKASNLSLKIFLGAFLYGSCGLMVPIADANIIDDNYGGGAGSFELGTFINGGGSMWLTPGATTMWAGRWVDLMMVWIG